MGVRHELQMKQAFPLPPKRVTSVQGRGHGRGAKKGFGVMQRSDA